MIVLSLEMRSRSERDEFQFVAPVALSVDDAARVEVTAPEWNCIDLADASGIENPLDDVCVKGFPLHQMHPPVHLTLTVRSDNRRKALAGDVNGLCHGLPPQHKHQQNKGQRNRHRTPFLSSEADRPSRASVMPKLTPLESVGSCSIFGFSWDDETKRLRGLSFHIHFAAGILFMEQPAE